LFNQLFAFGEESFSITLLIGQLSHNRGVPLDSQYGSMRVFRM
jgi:hypothetical protein